MEAPRERKKGCERRLESEELQAGGNLEFRLWGFWRFRGLGVYGFWRFRGFRGLGFRGLGV